MKNGFYIFVLLLLTSCYDKLDSEQAKEAIQRYYSEASLSAGGGTFTINSIEILSNQQLNDSTYTVKAKVNGSHVNYSIAGEQNPEDFEYNNEYNIVKQEQLWKVISIQ